MRAQFDLTGKVAIVTGSTKGLGRAMAQGLAAAGASVVVSSRKQELCDKAASEIAADTGAETLGLACHVGDWDAIPSFVEQIVARFGRIDVLVNNAGIAKDQLMLRMKRHDWDVVLATNLTAAFALTQAVLKPMIKQRSGRIISISSVVGQGGNAGQANYAASKAGLIGFSKAVALEVASRGITVNVVAPGLIATDMTQTITEGARQEWESRIPLKRLGTPGDIAAAVCFLASNEAAYITGQVVAVNGGMYM
jgi:3-oxoacyl-[acyl-carrier protein] reductase